MRTLIVLVSCFLSASVGLPSKPIRHGPDPGSLDDFVFPEWQITNFDAGSSPGGCTLAFHISSAATASAPSITASCDVNGDDERQRQKCRSIKIGGFLAGEAVWAMPSLTSVDTFEVSIQHRFFYDAKAGLTPARFYNSTGNMTVDFQDVSMPTDLTVMGTTVSEAWWWLKVRAMQDAGEKGCVGQDRHVCEPVRNADGSIHGYMHLESELRSMQSA